MGKPSPGKTPLDYHSTSLGWGWRGTAEPRRASTRLELVAELAEQLSAQHLLLQDRVLIFAGDICCLAGDGRLTGGRAVEPRGFRLVAELR